MKVRTQERAWSSTQTRLPDGAVESVQRMTFSRPVVEHSQAGARRLGERSWHAVDASNVGRRCSEDSERLSPAL